ncbi:restriction endonuclease [Gracilibacillus suaedae]|uniref:restriction endonuclease n=1 Tax=Gracilibacillus suaedae TaxID=2820273 RepID=UPI001ABDC080|nr:restriction endonuclease [Gracilibacillus suaedae]
MKKSDRDTIYGLISCSIILIGYFLLWDTLTSVIPSYIYVFAVPIVAAVIGGLIIRQIPIKKQTKKKKTPINKSNSKGKKTIHKKDIPHNLFRSEKEILTLPIEQISWREFEEVCYLYFKAKGCKPRRTGEGADGGVDLIIYSKEDQADEAVQIKHYINSGNQIDVKPIRELDSAKKNKQCMLARFITSSTFTNPAMVEAGDRGITTNSIHWVKSNLDPWRTKEAKKKKYI